MHEVQGIEHVAIAVQDAAEAVEHFRAMGFALGPVEEVEGGIRSHILESAGASIEILESTDPTSTLSRYLERVGEGLHHLCLRVSSLEDAVYSAKAAGCTLVDSEPKVDSVGRRVFVHPRSNYGALMGLLEPDEPEKARVIDPGLPEFHGMTFSPAVTKGGEVIAVSGLNALDGEGRVQHEGDVVGQARVIYQKLADILDHAGAGPGDVIKTTDYILSREGYGGTAAVRRQFFGDHRPAATGVVVKELIGRGVLIEIEAIAIR